MGDLDGKKNRHLSLELCLSENKESSQIQGNSRVRAKTLDQLGKPEWKRIRGNVGEIAVDTHSLFCVRYDSSNHSRCSPAVRKLFDANHAKKGISRCTTSLQGFRTFLGFWLGALGDPFVTFQLG